MVVKHEEINTNEVKVYIESTPEQVAKAISEAYRRNKSKYPVKGFRPGKAPQKIIEQFYGKEAFYNDAFDIFVNEEYFKFIEEKKLNVYGEPAFGDIVIEDGKMAFSAQIKMLVMPEFGQYKGIEVPDLKAEVKDEAVEKAIRDEIKKNSRLVEVTGRPAQNRDVLSVDFVGTIDGVEFEGGKAENTAITLGEGKFIPGFEEQLTGAEAGSDVVVKVKFPEDYGKEDLAGKEAEFQVKVHDIKIWEEPEFNDEFVSDISEYETVDEYKAMIKEKLLNEAEFRIKKEKEDFAVKKLIEISKIPLPEQMIQEHFKDDKESFVKRLESYGMTLESYLQMLGATEEDNDKEMAKTSYKNLVESYALVKLAEKEELFPDAEQLEEIYKLHASQYRISLDEFKKAVSERPGMKQYLFEEAMKEAALKLIMDNSVAIDPASLKVDDTEAEDVKTDGPAEEDITEAPAKKKKSKT